ncbi:MAG: hypothetical protein JWN86_3849 [Planctomycetota bacterium]|nr:hypothetical protein [Planctomycetota bacterium]
MSEPIEPIRHKMTEAMPDKAKDPVRPGHETRDQDPSAPHQSELKTHNAQVQPGVKDRLVDIGRGEQTKGRGDK